MAKDHREIQQQRMFTEHLKTVQQENAPGAGLCSRLDSYVKAVKAMASQCPEIGQPDRVWLEEVSEILEDFNEELEAARQRAKDCHRAGWEAWLQRSFKGGARAMHRYTRIAQEWAPAVTVRSGRVTAAPQDVLDSELDELAELWRAQSTPQRACVPDRATFPRASAAEVRRASSSFSVLTSQSLDGTHPKQLSLLSDSALECLAAIYQAVEAIGMFPQQLWWMLLPLLEKPKGGYRTILLCAGPVRVWQRLRRPYLTEFDRTSKRDYWACGAGRSAGDAVWKQSAGAEAGRGEDLETAGFLWGGKKYHASFDLHELRRRALAARVHLVVAKVQFN